MHCAYKFYRFLEPAHYARVPTLAAVGIIVWLVIAASSLGQDADPRELPSTTLLVSASIPSAPRIAVVDKHRPPILPRELADLEIALGRMRLVPDRFRIVRKHEQSSSDEFERTVQVATAEGRPTLRLNYVDNAEKWSLCIDPIVGAEWTREYLLDQKPTSVKYSQRPTKPIVVEITQAGHHGTRLEAATLWHLTAQNSIEFQKFVLPALKRLNGSWDLPGSLAAARRMRTLCAGLHEEACIQSIERCVMELESTDHSVRSTAMEQLRGAGLAAQIPLERLTHQSLTTQQRSTINQLLAELEPRSADTPTRLAYWLSGDPNWR